MAKQRGRLRKVLRILGIGMAVVVGLVAVAAGSLLWIGGRRLAAGPADLPDGGPAVSMERRAALAEAVAWTASAERGKRLVGLAMCSTCHGEDLGGQEFIDSPPFAVLAAPNLTGGAGGVGGTYGASDWERAIRHGLAIDGRPLMIMPSTEFAHFTDGDLADMIAYLESLPAVDRRLPPRRVGPIGRVVAALQPGELLPVYAIDHQAVGAATYDPADPLSYGRYLAQSCTACHRDDFGGGPVDFAEPGDPPARNLTPDATGLAEWTREDFTRAITTGRRPDGSELDELMPWRSYAGLDPEQVDALWTYLRTVEPVARDIRALAAAAGSAARAADEPAG